MSQLELKQNKQGTTLNLTISGSIDEDADFAHVDLNEVELMIVNLNGLKGLNSCGIREWIRWTQKFPDTLKVAFLNCPKIAIEQMNMVEGFLPKNGIVKSFYIPYYCEECDSVTNYLQEVKQGVEVDAPEEIQCENCKQTAEIDVIEAKYFKFLK
jgi:hypothetical protein